MRKILSLITLTALMVALAGSCTKNIEERIDKTDAEVAALQTAIGQYEKLQSDITTVIQALRAEVGNRPASEQQSVWNCISALQTQSNAFESALNALQKLVGETSVDSQIEEAVENIISAYNLDELASTLKSLDEEIAKKFDVKSLEKQVDQITKTVREIDYYLARINAFYGLLQSVAIIPQYEDGSIKASDKGVVTFECIVTPAEVLAGVSAAKLKEAFTLNLFSAEVKTKAGESVEIPVTSAEVRDLERGIVEITADVSHFTVSDGKSLMLALNVKLGASNYSTGYVPVTAVTSPVNEPTKVADYLYEYTAEGYDPNPPSELLFDDGPVPIFGCSAVRNGNFYGRNLDFNINEICEFVIRTKATATRPHASIGVANTCFLNITNSMVENGLSDKYLKYIPWMTLDGINDAGLVCNINVVNAADIKENPHTHTNEGAPQIMVMQLVRALLDNCGSVAEAKTYIESHDIRPIPATWDGHIMIADPNETVIVEFTGEKGKEVKFVKQRQMIMTNFYNHLFNEEQFLSDHKPANFPAHSCGMERYWILSDNYNTGNSMQGMWELLKKVKYTQAYDTSVDPFWCSEYYDTAKIPTFDNFPMEYWTKEKVLAEEDPKKEVAAYAEYAKTHRYKEEDGLWFTSHNSTYDIENKALWVTVREKYESVHKFEF